MPKHFVSRDNHMVGLIRGHLTMLSVMQGCHKVEQHSSTLLITSDPNMDKKFLLLRIKLLHICRLSGINT